MTKDLYRPSLALLTDFYQVTMAYGYWKKGFARRESVFSLYFRQNPFGGGYAVNAGLEYVIDFLDDFHFSPSDIEYLSSLKSPEGAPVFEKDFLEYLSGLKLDIDVDAIPEGTVVFPYEPLIRVKGPILQCQLIETPLLNMVNFQTLVATKSARMNYAAQGEPIIEFGLRRAQGIDGAIAASRAAYIGGCASTSNLMAGKLFGIPVAGTHAHSWIMTFDTEVEAFKAYAEALPDYCVFLVDTYDTLEGIRNAISVGKVLRENGKKMVGIRIDSGDLAYFSQQARKMLDEAGFDDAQIVASNDLDEHLIQSMRAQEAKITTWGIGTKLVTAYDQPALGAVYKLSALKNEIGDWEPRLKLTEQTLKVNIPGLQQVRRYFGTTGMVGDMIYDETIGISDKNVIYHPADPTKRKKLDATSLDYEDLLKPVMRKGVLVYKLPDIQAVRGKREQEVSLIHSGIKRFENPHIYPVGLEAGLHNMKMELILKLKKYEE